MSPANLFTVTCHTKWSSSVTPTPLSIHVYIVIFFLGGGGGGGLETPKPPPPPMPVHYINENPPFLVYPTLNLLRLVFRNI